MKTYKITLFGVKETTKIIAEYLAAQAIPIDLIVSIDQSVVRKNDIADYADLENTAKSIGADYYCVKDYALKIVPDDFFQRNEFQVGLVYGWQRLIPETVIAKFSKGIFGFHASPDLLPKGRGRSPLNWGIICGKTTFYNHCFRYSKAADAGDIYSVTPFSITPHDTILTVLYKSLLIAKREIVRLLGDLQLGPLTLTSQGGETYFFPKRMPEDGLIHFDKSTTTAIINLIRGVTKPFSGAYSFTASGKKIIIWEAWEFDHILDFSNYQPGQVIDNLYHMPIIRTIDGSIVIRQYEGALLMPNDKLG